MHIALFPLNTILFPDGLLPLRIFETRYLDMVSACMKADQAFGVCVIRKGREAGAASEPHSIGTLARIVDFQKLPDGLLGVTAKGEQKFSIQNTQRQADELLTADVNLIAPEGKVILPNEYQRLAGILQRIMPEVEEQYGADAMQYLQPDYTDASWVGGRLVEILPIELDLKQRFLEMQDPIERLNVLYEALSQMPSEE